jgi:hypothetical protein
LFSEGGKSVLQGLGKTGLYRLIIQLTRQLNTEFRHLLPDGTSWMDELYAIAKNGVGLDEGELQLLINSKNIDDRAFDRSYALINDWLKHGRYDEALQVVYSQEAAVFERFMKNHRLLTTFCEDFVSSNGLRDLFLGDLTTVKAWEVMYSNQSFRTNPDLLQRMSDDIATAPGFDDFIRQNPDKLEGWRVWQGTFNSAGDPVRDILGPGRLSHSNEWNQLLAEMENAGVEVTFSQGRLAYAPGLRIGEPGQIKIDPDASITALRHEHRHFLDDQNVGWGGYGITFDPDFRVTSEYNAYRIEIEEMISSGHIDVANQLKTNFQNEVNDIMQNFGTAQPSVLALIDDLMNL